MGCFKAFQVSLGRGGGREGRGGGQQGKREGGGEGIPEGDFG